MDIPLSQRAYDARPWGNFERFTLNEQTTVKIITVNPHSPLSLQRHTSRDEFWRILSGSGTVTIGTDTLSAKTGDEFFIPKTTLHRAIGGDVSLVFLEIAFGSFDENDIERIEDAYGRA